MFQLSLRIPYQLISNSFFFNFLFKQQKNMCILTMTKNLLDQAKLAGLSDEQIEPTINLLLTMRKGYTLAYQNSLLVR